MQKIAIGTALVLMLNLLCGCGSGSYWGESRASVTPYSTAAAVTPYSPNVQVQRHSNGTLNPDFQLGGEN
jgi:hypothetical protein